MLWSHNWQVLTRPSASGLMRLLLGGGVSLLVISLALPFYGWYGLRTVGLALGLLSALGLVVGTSWRLRGALMALGLTLALTSCALIGWRLIVTPAGRPSAFPGSVAQLPSTAALAVGLAGALSLAGAASVGLLGNRQGSRPGQLKPDAGQRSPAAMDRLRAVSHAWSSLWSSRLLVWVAGLLGVLKAGTHAIHAGPQIAHPLGSLGSILTAPATAWDAGAYLGIAQFGYAAGHYYDAYFPLYPALIRAGSWSPGASLVSAIVISLAALGAALYLLHRLVALEWGNEAADLTVLLVAIFPMAFFYSAVYTESLFLALSVGSIYSARRGWWGRAGIAGGLAAATRVTGILVLVPVLLMYANRRKASSWLRPDAVFLLLIPLGLLLCFAYQGAHGDWLASLHSAHTYWHRRFIPGVAAVDGVGDFVRSLHQIAAGEKGGILLVPTFREAGQLSDPLKLAAANVTDFGFLVFACIATIGAIRRLPAPYGAYAAVSVAVAASSVPRFEPLASFPRYLAVVFPCQIWLALWARGHPRRRAGAVIASGGLLALFASQFASWTWVA